MADETEIGEVEDSPGERAEEFFERIGVVPTSFYGVISGAQARAESASADPGAPGWTPIGPRNVGGAIRSLAQDHVTTNSWYAGSAQGGLWKTNDDGATWSAIGSTQMLAPVGALAVAPSDARYVYVGTGEPHYAGISGNGLFRSKDRGVTFERLVNATDGTGSSLHYGRIQIDPQDATRCWAASKSGLFRFHDSSADEEVFPGVAAGTAVSDVVLARDPADTDKYVLLAGVVGLGIFRGVYSRRSGQTAWAAVGGAPVAGIGRIRLAFSNTKVGVAATPWAYAIMEDLGFSGAVASVRKYPTLVFQSKDFGLTWPARPAAGPVPAAVSPSPPPPPPAAPATSPGSAWYALAIAVDPNDPTRVVVGNVNVHLSANEGRTWTLILDWLRYSAGDRAQHADQHAIVFDMRDSQQFWVGNDGGVSFTPDRGAHWQKRSYGIVAAQLTDLTTHPSFPFIFGGGMQDNGTFVSFGGPTWYRLSGGDGGQMAFTPSAAAVPPAVPVFARSFITSTQEGVNAVSIASVPGARNSTTLPDVAAPGNVMTPSNTGSVTFPAGNPSTFIGIVEGDGQTVNRLLLGRKNTTPAAAVAGFYSTDGATVAPITTPGLTGNVSVVKFAPNAPDMWLGTTTGKLFTATASPPAPPAVGPAWTARVLPGAPNNAIACIAVHPTNHNVVAVSTMGSPGAVYLSHDAGAHFRDISGSGGDRLTPGPVLCVTFHPQNTQVLFAGTLAGVFVIRNLPAAGAPAAVPAFDPAWKTYNNGLPLVQINDLTVTPVTLTLRCATFGRGAFECSINGATPAAFEIPNVFLSIREVVSDDGRNYAAANRFFDDPRLPAVAPAPTDFDHTRALDVRVDAPPFSLTQGQRFGTPLDGAEFDETLVSDQPLVGDTNFVYVQAHNRGATVANDVAIHLYFADAGNAPAGAPDLTADLNFPLEPAAGSAWQRAAPLQSVVIAPGQPHVARFAWIPPLRVRDNVALLAICSQTSDALAAVPASTAVAFVTAERRAAMRIAPVVRDAVYIRDGVDDTGFVGGVAWGGRSPDIVVRQTAIATPEDPVGELGDLRDSHLSDRVRPGNNFVYVRVWNRTAVSVDARVQVYRVPNPALPTPGPGWLPLAAAAIDVPAIPPRSWRIATLAWNGVTDPDPANGYKAFALVAVASVLAGGVELDPFPDRSTATDIDSFWRFGLLAPLANNAALRALRFDPNPAPPP